MKGISTLAQVGFLAACLIVCSETSTAQNWDDFADFDKGTTQEQKSGSKFKNISRLSYYADTLPTWFFALPKEQGVFYAIGISDPDMEQEEAKTLAMHRAKTMAVLLSNCKVQYIRDIYSSVNDYNKYADVRERFDTYFKISSSNQVNRNMFAVVDTHFTKYNEYMVLLKYLPEADFEFETDNADDEQATSYINVAGSSFIVEASVSGAFDVQAEYEVLSYDKGSLLQKGDFVYREKASRFLSNSYFNDMQVDFPLYPYIYASPAWTTARSAYSSYSGLWSIYIRQFMNYISISCENSSVRMKNTDQKYGEEMVYLSREIASFLAELRINGINFDTDTMKFDLDIVQMKQLIK